MMLRKRDLLVLTLVTLTGACEERPDHPSPERTAVAEHPAEPSHAPARPAAVAPLNESQSVEALGTLNHGEVELATYALGRAQTAPGRELAQMMIDQHTQAEADVVAWAQAHAVLGEANDVTPSVLTTVSSVRTRLEYASDADFDRTYAQTQIEMHEGALDILDDRILPGVSDADFRVLVTTLRGGVATHLAHARMVLTEVPASSGAVAAGEHTH